MISIATATLIDGFQSSSWRAVMRKHSDLFRFYFRSVTILQTALEESQGLRRSARIRGVYGEASLRKALVQSEEHYHTERNHQGLENQIIQPMDEVAETIPIIDCSERLGGLLRYYYRRAA